MGETFGTRLRKERLRLKLTQANVGDHCGVAKRTVMAWEKSTPIPVDKLAALEPLGFDVSYVVRGTRAPLAGAVNEETAGLLEGGCGAHDDDPPHATFDEKLARVSRASKSMQKAAKQTGIEVSDHTLRLILDFAYFHHLDDAGVREIFEIIAAAREHN